MPRMISFDVNRPNDLSKCSPSRPYQFVRSASTVVGCAMIAGVQSTVWIFAISRRDHEPRLVVEILVVELGIARVQVLADGVVLAHEERVEQRQADPEVLRDTGRVDVRLDL